MYTPRLGPAPSGDGWELMAQTPTIETWVREVAPGCFEKCDREWVGPILEDNLKERNENYGKRWNDVQKFASIPLQFYYDHIVPAKRQGDEAYIKKILNDSDYSKLRTKEGRI